MEIWRLTMRRVIDRAAFLENTAIPREDVPVPELGEGAVVPVWGMTAGERTKFEQSMLGKDGKQNKAKLAEIRQLLVVATCRNDDGSPLFTAEDVAAIGQKRADIIERIVNVAQRLSGFSGADLEATVKNSGAIQ
jgi:hypothetical protein